MPEPHNNFQFDICLENTEVLSKLFQIPLELLAGVNPIAVAGAGREMNATSLGVMLPVAGIGAIVMPWLISCTLYSWLVCRSAKTSVNPPIE